MDLFSILRLIGNITNLYIDEFKFIFLIMFYTTITNIYLFIPKIEN